jgi:hypothetical protein
VNESLNQRPPRCLPTYTIVEQRDKLAQQTAAGTEQKKMDTATSSTAIGNGGGNSSSSLNNNANPPSIELAYKKKCIQLKKRLNEIEAENDSMRARNKRAKSYIQKMRLETCIMLERLATLTGMLDDQQAQSGSGPLANPELRAKAAAIMDDARAAVGHDVLDDETEGSSEERPPTVFPTLFLFL